MPEPRRLPAIKSPWDSASPTEPTVPSGTERSPIAVPDHVLLRCIGRGAYGEVWLARNALGQYRAVKIVHRAAFDNDRPFEREFAGIQRFEPISRSHESQLNILHVGRGDGCFYYVMELADDMGRGQDIDEASYAPRSLRSDLQFRGRLPVEECVRLGLALSTALEHLHRHGLVHRDIKPSNIVFVNGIPKLADIGLVAQAERTMSFVGTEGYLPPEGPGTVQADLFSLGKVLYEIATGHDRQQFPDLPTRVEELSDRHALVEFNEVLLRACAPDSKQRYKTAAEMHADLALLDSGGSVKRRHQLDRRLQIAKQVGAVAIATTVLLTGAWLWQSQQTLKMTRLVAEKTALATENAQMAAEARQNELRMRQNLYAADINLAQQALLAHNLPQVRELLGKHVPSPGQVDLRGFEWRYLWHQSRSEELFSLPALTNGAQRIAFSPDGRWLAAAGWNRGPTEIWDLQTRHKIASLPGTEDSRSVSFSPDGSLLVTASATYITLWNGRDFTPIFRLTDAGEAPEAGTHARFSPDGRWLLTSGLGTWKLWDTATWEWSTGLELGGEWKYPGMEGDESWISFAPDGARIAVLCADAVRLFSVPQFDGETFEQLDLIPLELNAGPSARALVKFSPDNKTLAVLGTSGFNIRLWDTAAQQEIGLLSGHTDHVLGLSFSADGSRIATCSADKTIKLWNVPSGNLLHTFVAGNVVTDVAFSPDGTRLATVGGSIVKLWDVNPANMQDFFREPPWPVGFKREGGLLAFDAKLHSALVDPATRQVTNTEDTPLIESRAIALRLGVLNRKDPSAQEPWFDPYLGNLSSDGRTVALFDGWKYLMTAFDLQERRVLCTVAATQPWAIFAPRRGLLATITTNETATVWQLPAGTKKWVFTVALGGSQTIAFSPDEDFIVTCERTHLKLWRIDGDEAKEAGTFDPRHNLATGLAWSPDARMLATAEEGGTIRLWSMPSTKAVGVLTGHTRDVLTVAFSPDGRSLASMCDDRTVRLWHVATRRELLRFVSPKEDQAFFSLLFSPDGRALAARRVDDEGPITWLWHAPSTEEITRLDQMH